MAATSPAPQRPSPIAQAIQQRIASAINPPVPPRVAVSGASTFTTRAQIQRGIPAVSTIESVKLMGGAFAGAAVSALIISKLFPRQRVLTALALGVGSSVLAASSPPASLAENLGLGGAIGSALFLLLDLSGEIVAPPATSALAEVNPPAADAATLALRGMRAA